MHSGNSIWGTLIFFLIFTPLFYKKVTSKHTHSLLNINFMAYSNSHKLMEGADNLCLMPYKTANALECGFTFEIMKLITFSAMWYGKQ